MNQLKRASRYFVLCIMFVSLVGCGKLTDSTDEVSSQSTERGAMVSASLQKPLTWPDQTNDVYTVDKIITGIVACECVIKTDISINKFMYDREKVIA